ncbi:hypothetical protein [Saccharospirillum sp.]|uniref:hypothetical protein n=1 Tax=Saccharospirillum sp. TaxID=2033801 RepID=UPI00349FD273
MSSEVLLGRTVKALLQGGIICDYADRELADYLSEEDNRERVRAFLQPLNRDVRATTDGRAWIPVYASINDATDRSEVRQSFKLVANQIEPLVGWLRLVMIAQQRPEPIVMGDTLYDGDLTKQLDQVPHLMQQLEVILGKGPFRKSINKDSPRWVRDGVTHIFEKLTEMGFFVKPGGTGAAYRATGKWSWLYDMMDYIQSKEGIPVEDPGSGDEHRQTSIF